SAPRRLRGPPARARSAPASPRRRGLTAPAGTAIASIGAAPLFETRAAGSHVGGGDGLLHCSRRNRRCRVQSHKRTATSSPTTTHECAAHQRCAPAPAAVGGWRSAHSSENPEARASDGLGATDTEGLDQAVPATAAAHVAQAAPLPPVARLAD